MDSLVSSIKMLYVPGGIKSTDQAGLGLFFFWLRCVFVAERGFSLIAVSGGYSLLQCAGFSLRWLLLLRSTGSRHVGFSSCGAWAQ